MADIILYTCAHLPPEDPSWRPGSESLEDVLNGESRAGKTLAFVMPSFGGRDVTLIFTSPLVCP